MMRENRRLQDMDDRCSQQQLEQKAAAAAALSSQLSHTQTLRRVLEEERRRSSVIATLEPALNTGHISMPKLAVPSPAALQNHAYNMQESSCARSAES
jgi:hypothetical protein